MGIFSSKTKTTFRRTPREEKRFRQLLTLGVAAIVLAIVFQGIFGSLFSYAAAPFHTLSVWFEESDTLFALYLRTKASLIEDRDRLEGELMRLEDADTRINQLERDNQMLRAFLGSGYEPRIGAGVVLRPSDTPYDTLLIDRGGDDGIIEGALVFVDGERAIGRVIEAFPKSALVALFTTPGVTVPAYIFGPDVFAAAEGVGGGVLRVGVPQGVQLSPGDPVIIPTAAPGVLGAIAHIEADESNPVQYGYVPLSVSLSELRFVAVDTTPLPDISYDTAAAMVEEARSHFATTTDIVEPIEGTVSTGTAPAE